DILNVLETSRAVNCSVPFSVQVLEMMLSVANHGGENLDHASISRYYEVINNLSLQESVES
ncbi:MAG: 2-hydroxy-3-oxopropionate reductase, partial [Cloacibacillus sp.]